MWRRAIVAGILVGLALLLVLDAVAARLGFVAGAFARGAAPWPWIASRAAGVAAFLALTLAVLFGLFVSTGAADRWIARPRSVEIHKWLGSVALALVGAHALLLLADGFIRFDVLDTVVPFLAEYRPAAVAMGVMATYAAIVVIASFHLRTRLGARTWRRLHGLSFVAFLLAAGHAIVAGSDAREPAIFAMYVVAGCLVAVLTGWRAWLVWRSLPGGNQARRLRGS